MTSEWKVTSNSINGKKMYGAYRVIDPKAVDHSGNRENYGGYTTDKNEVLLLVEKLNHAIGN